MPEPTSPVTELTSQYVSQVTNDLERNVKEQDRITAEIAALQEQLGALQHDHTLLVSMQQALGVASTVGAPAVTDGAVVPAPRKQPAAATSGTRRAPKKAAAEPSDRKKPASAAKAGTAKKAAVKQSAAGKTSAVKKSGAAQAAQPTLVELVRRHLGEQQEPRSAAEVAEALATAHPGREIQTKVIRTTLENLVARNSAQRSKQGSSVFYTLAPAGGSTQADATGEAGTGAAE